jgi:hypothetical protein
VNYIFDLFPARVVVCPEGSFAGIDIDTFSWADAQHVQDSRRIEAVRVVILNDKILVASDSSAGPVLIFREGYDAATLVHSKKRATLTTSTGKFLAIDKDQNCGCGSRLRSWSPSRIMNSSKDPVE